MAGEGLGGKRVRWPVAGEGWGEEGQVACGR